MTDTTQAAQVPTQIVIANSEQATQWQQAIGAELQQIWQTAKDQRDAQTMDLVNSAWSKTQELAKLTESSVVAGAAALQQRDATMSELNDLLEALDNHNDNHPQLEAFSAAIREEQDDYALEYAFDVTGEELYENIADLLATALQALDPRYEDPIREAPRHIIIGRVIEAIEAEPMNAEQQAAFLAFIKTFWHGQEAGD